MTLMRYADLACRTAIIYFALGFGLSFLEGAVDQPHPIYADGTTWLTGRLPEAAGFGALTGVVAALLVLLDPAAQLRHRATPLDLAYYPTPRGLRRCMSVMPARLFLIIGLLLLAGWFAHTQLDFMLQSTPPVGLVWPPPRVLAAGLVLWGILWLADCLARPGQGPGIAAIGFLTLAVCFSSMIENIGTLRE